MLSDDLKNCEHNNVALQAQRDVYKDQLQKCQDIITHLKTRHVPHAKVPGKYKFIIIVRKHTTSAKGKFHNLPYYVARIQRRKRYVKLMFHDHEIIVEIQIVSMHLIGLKKKGMQSKNTTILD